MARIMSELATYGFTCHAVTGDGNICGHSFTSVWIDEAPNVGNIGQTPGPQLSFLARCIRQCYGIAFDDIELTPCHASGDTTITGLFI